MKRMSAAIASLIIASPAWAHFVFVIPDESGPGQGKVIFSDTLKPDERVNVEKIADTKLFEFDASGKDRELKWTLDKAGAHYKLEVPGAGSHVIVALTDFGVLQRGEAKPFRLHYYAKGILGAIPAPSQATLGQRVPLELVPVVEGGALRFRAFAAGKPLAKAEVTVILPGADKTRDVVTDEKGMTPSFDQVGLYGARVRLIESRSGEDRGKKYDEVRHYATLVIRFGAPNP